MHSVTLYTNADSDTSSSS